jgi:hypothetical protein
VCRTDPDRLRATWQRVWWSESPVHCTLSENTLEGSKRIINWRGRIVLHFPSACTIGLCTPILIIPLSMMHNLALASWKNALTWDGKMRAWSYFNSLSACLYWNLNTLKLPLAWAHLDFGQIIDLESWWLNRISIQCWPSTLRPGPGLRLAEPGGPTAMVSVLPFLPEDGRRSSFRNVVILLTFWQWTN